MSCNREKTIYSFPIVDSGVPTIKLRFTNSSTIYAAKIFYNTGADLGMVSVENNLQLLKEGLLRQVAIQAAVNAFNKAEAKVAIHDLQFPDSFILEVKDGIDDGEKAWFVDSLLNSARTCDAFAHFALIDSGLEFVPTNIQGIDTPIIRNGIQGANAIVLFDLMGNSQANHGS